MSFSNKLGIRCRPQTQPPFSIFLMISDNYCCFLMPIYYNLRRTSNKGFFKVIQLHRIFTIYASAIH